MTSMIPKTIYGPVEHVARGAGETYTACVDCALEGTSHPLALVYTVAGTVLCKEHALVARRTQTEKVH